MRMYRWFYKRLIDFLLSFCVILVLSPLLVSLVIIGAIILKGNPFFLQPRPGKKGKDNQEKIFRLFKLRTMTNEKDENGKFLPDEKRLTSYGKWLRNTSLDELFELFNILLGDMSMIGPRPQLVKDLVFMNEEQRHRHDVRPGLSGLAQISGRNAITWDKKLSTDLEYISNISFKEDFKIIIKTIITVIKGDGISEDGLATAADFGDYLLKTGKITPIEYDKKQIEAREILRKAGFEYE